MHISTIYVALRKDQSIAATYQILNAYLEENNFSKNYQLMLNTHDEVETFILIFNRGGNTPFFDKKSAYTLDQVQLIQNLEAIIETIDYQENNTKSFPSIPPIVQSLSTKIYRMLNFLKAIENQHPLFLDLGDRFGFNGKNKINPICTHSDTFLILSHPLVNSRVTILSNVTYEDIESYLMGIKEIQELLLKLIAQYGFEFDVKNKIDIDTFLKQTSYLKYYEEKKVSMLDGSCKILEEQTNIFLNEFFASASLKKQEQV